MSDPIDWDRRHASPNNLRLWADVRSLIALRKSHPALLRNEVDFFWFHPTFDGDGGERVFAYCRTAGKELGRTGQVVVVVNAGARDYPSFDLPWRWASSGAREVAPPAYRLEVSPHGDGSWARISLAPFQVHLWRRPVSWRFRRHVVEEVEDEAVDDSVLILHFASPRTSNRWG
jgi:1,4-alpha-glucan branching enzyme